MSQDNIKEYYLDGKMFYPWDGNWKLKQYRIKDFVTTISYLQSLNYPTVKIHNECKFYVKIPNEEEYTFVGYCTGMDINITTGKCKYNIHYVE